MVGVISIIVLIFLIVRLIKLYRNDKNPSSKKSVVNSVVMNMEEYPVPDKLKESRDNLIKLIREGKSSRDIEAKKLNVDEETASDKELMKYIYCLVDVLNDRADDKINLNMEMSFNDRKTFDLNLHDRESVIYHNTNVSLYTIQKLFSEVSYGGTRAVSPAYRGGYGTVKAREVEGLKLDDNGQFFITNQRVAFISDRGDVLSIGLGAIASQRPYEDKGILLCLENHSPVVFDFYSTYKYNKKLGIIFDDRREAFNMLYAAIHEQ